jgi:hypothetical protein
MKFKKKSILKKIPKVKKNRNQKNKDQIKKKQKQNDGTILIFVEQHKY